MVEVDDAEFGAAGAGEGCCGVGTYAAATYYYYEGIAEFGQAFILQKNPVAG